LCESGYANVVVEIDPLTGHVFSSFPARVVPGLTWGPGALAIHPVTGNLFLFSGLQSAGEVTQAGALVNTINPHHIAASAFDPTGDLYAVDDAATGGDGAIHRVNQLTGAFETTVPINGYTERVSAMDFDPVSGALFLYADMANDLLEIDLETGDVVSVTDVGVFLGAIKSPLGFSAGFAFNEDGTQIYLSKGDDWIPKVPLGGEFLLVLDRVLPDCFVQASLSDLGNGLPGTSGFTPTLTGGMVAGQCQVRLQFTSSIQAAEVLVVGLRQIAAPFKGGVFVPAPDLLLADVFDLSGTLLIDVSSPVLVDLPLYMQVWVPDPSGPSGFAASNGLAMTVN
jgi:hypothetical protein